MERKILCADPELAEQVALERLSPNQPIRLYHAFSYRALARELKQRDIDLLILGRGVGSLAEIAQLVRQTRPALNCIVTGAPGNLPLDLGWQQLPKPLDLSRLEEMIDLSLNPRSTPASASGLGGPFSQLLTTSKPMLEAIEYAAVVAPSAEPLLITGETGTGKDLLARAVHQASGLSGRFVAVNVAGLDEEHFSDTLFGHQKGSFTGADQARAGQVRQAEGGTLFLDEIGDLALENQVKLLRLVQDGECLPLGADRVQQVKTRVVVATNQNLEASLQSGRFRSDLYFRLRTHHVELTPLRERPEDLELLIRHYLLQGAQALERDPLKGEGLAERLQTYPFPGNVRELKGLLMDATACCRTEEQLMGYFERFLDQAPAQGAPVSAEESVQFGRDLPTLYEVRRLLVDEALRRSDNNRNRAAHLLGIRRQSINHYLK